MFTIALTDFVGTHMIFGELSHDFDTNLYT